MKKLAVVVALLSLGLTAFAFGSWSVDSDIEVVKKYRKLTVTVDDPAKASFHWVSRDACHAPPGSSINTIVPSGGSVLITRNGPKNATLKGRIVPKSGVDEDETPLPDLSVWFVSFGKPYVDKLASDAGTYNFEIRVNYRPKNAPVSGMKTKPVVVGVRPKRYLESGSIVQPEEKALLIADGVAVADFTATWKFKPNPKIRRAPRNIDIAGEIKCTKPEWRASYSSMLGYSGK